MPHFFNFSKIKQKFDQNQSFGQNKITEMSEITSFCPKSDLTVMWLQQDPRLLVVRRHCLLFSRGHSTVSNIWCSDD